MWIKKFSKTESYNKMHTNKLFISFAEKENEENKNDSYKSQNHY